MTETTLPENVREFRLRPKDIGVAIVFIVAIALALLVRYQVESKTTTYQDPDTPFRIAYPATWGNVESLQNALLKVEDPQTSSAYKTNLTVIKRELDPSSPPTLQTLVDRRVIQQGALTAYHFLANRDATIDGAKGMELEYAYTVQPIDQPRRASLPVVVHAREYVLISGANSYYITLAAPESDYERASAQFDEILKSVKLGGKP